MKIKTVCVAAVLIGAASTYFLSQETQIKEEPGPTLTGNWLRVGEVETVGVLFCANHSGGTYLKIDGAFPVTINYLGRWKTIEETPKYVVIQWHFSKRITQSNNGGRLVEESVNETPIWKIIVEENQIIVEAGGEIQTYERK